MQETQETQVWFLGQKDSLEEGMATHSSILAWRIPWTEEPGGPQSIQSRRVGHDWTYAHTATERRPSKTPIPWHRYLESLNVLSTKRLQRFHFRGQKVFQIFFFHLKTSSIVPSEVKFSLSHFLSITQTITYQPRRRVCISRSSAVDRVWLPHTWAHRLCHTGHSSCTRTWIYLFSYLFY